MTKTASLKTQEKQSEEKAKFKKFAYGLAWINFLAIIGLAVYNAIKDKKPPERDDFY